MQVVDRRGVLRIILSGVAAAGAGVSMMPSVADAVPVTPAKHLAQTASEPGERPQAVASRPPRRPLQSAPRHHRRRERPTRVCRWHRGRRVCD